LFSGYCHCGYRFALDGFVSSVAPLQRFWVVPATFHFSHEQARSMLPLLRLIVADISLSHRELTDRRSHLRRMLRSHQGKARYQVYDQEIVEMQKELADEARHLDDYISELERLGVILRSAHEGIVDFPTSIDDRRAFFTWQMGQDDVSDFHWHDESTAERRRLASTSPEG
jgi:hypothetical protein